MIDAQLKKDWRLVTVSEDTENNDRIEPKQELQDDTQEGQHEEGTQTKTRVGLRRGTMSSVVLLGLFG